MLEFHSGLTEDAAVGERKPIVHAAGGSFANLYRLLMRLVGTL